MIPAPEDQLRGYWIACTVLRRNTVPSDVTVRDAADARQSSVATLCVLGALTTLPRLRRRIMSAWPSLVPAQGPQGAA